ncbi:NADPH-binding protein [Nitzschia inconspicua]|uniref:NADPH-binding protein n=1 Tax=Nitzschia inconspicua TaxID=303405 RepID=A0A9K3LE25_9STRA|nr:NADPH-binding protein [Nitzschia inconspicua]
MTIVEGLKEKLKIVSKNLQLSSASRKKVIVIGSQYHIGRATLLALSSLHDETVDAYAGTDDKIMNAANIDGIQDVQANLADTAGLARSLVGYDAAYIVVPCHGGGTQLTINGIQAAKQADVKFILLLSVIGQDSDEATFEKKFQPIRDAVEDSGIEYSIIKLPLEPEKPVAVGDVGKESAKILADPSDHVGKEYKFEASH